MCSISFVAMRDSNAAPDHLVDSDWLIEAGLANRTVARDRKRFAGTVVKKTRARLRELLREIDVKEIGPSWG